MYSELDCGICYRTFNAGRRCPRELHCKHSFCESCLLVLSRPPGPDDVSPGDRSHIVCPLCRQTTSISSKGTVRAELSVDECVLERLLAAGAPDQDDDDEEEGDPKEKEGDPKEKEGGDNSEEATRLETPAEESDAGTRGGALRRSWKKIWKKMWRKIVGKGTRRGGENCMTSIDLRSLALMSCYVF